MLKAPKTSLYHTNATQVTHATAPVHIDGNGFIQVEARNQPTKTYWDWSEAGDEIRAEDPHTYLKKKGSFVYEKDLVPEYRWYNGSADRYEARLRPIQKPPETAHRDKAFATKTSPPGAPY